MCRTCRSISCTRTSLPVFRVPLYPAKSSFSFSPGVQGLPRPSIHPKRRISRSEEHTSELQSRRDLVCRLLLEKKKNKATTQTIPEQRVLRHISSKAVQRYFTLDPSL